jgi:YHS domain-containing protein
MSGLMTLRDVRPRDCNEIHGTNAKEVLMETDVVCGMKVDPTRAPAQSQHQGKLYYFCSTDCKAKFDANPEQYAKKSEQYAKAEQHAR